MTKKTAAKPVKKSAPKNQKQQFDILSLPDVVNDGGAKTKSTPITFVETSHYGGWLKSQSTSAHNQYDAQGFKAKPNQVALAYGDDGKISAVVIGYSKQIGLYTVCGAVDKIGTGKFHIANDDLKSNEIDNIVTGWFLACYKFTAFKSSAVEFPTLLTPKSYDDLKSKSLAQAIYMVRNLINLPPNALGPQALADAAVMVAKIFGAKSRVVEDTELLTENLPMIYAVGDGSERRPPNIRN